ncbi:mucin-4-like [Saccostrea cucullata]|uniref:mucin-4-like n=1 Tax=Saccostrea cuccullata TaxID=36930 RepID=UPI002ED6BD17
MTDGPVCLGTGWRGVLLENEEKTDCMSYDTRHGKLRMKPCDISLPVACSSSPGAWCTNGYTSSNPNLSRTIEESATVSPYLSTTEESTTVSLYLSTTEESTTKSPYLSTTEESTTVSPYLSTTEESTTVSPYLSTTEESTTVSPYLSTTEESTTVSPYLSATEESTTISSYLSTTEESTTVSPYLSATEESTTVSPYLSTTVESTTVSPYLSATEESTTVSPYLSTTEESTTVSPYLSTTEESTIEVTTESVTTTTKSLSCLNYGDLIFDPNTTEMVFDTSQLQPNAGTQHSFPNGTNVIFACLHNHRHRGGNLNRECLPNGTWSGEKPNCTRCMCPCERTKKQVIIKNDEELKTKINKMKKDLAINKMEVNQRLRKRISASDPRPTAIAMGTILGPFLIILFIGAIVISDLMTMVRHFKSCPDKGKKKKKVKERERTKQGDKSLPLKNPSTDNKVP